MDPIIISVAPNGARKTKKHNPAMPLTADEIAEDARLCMEEGATLLHMHIRDKNNLHTLDVCTYKKATEAVRKAVGDKMIIQVTSEEVGIYKPHEQMQMVRDLKPESVSLAIREIIPNPSFEEHVKDFLAFAREEKIIPQYILYNEDEVKYFADLRKRKIVPGEKVFVLFVLGKRSKAVDPLSSYAQPEDLDPYLECFGDGVIALADTVWSVAAFGGNENACVLRAVECGGHPRIGFENNHLMSDGKPAENNAELVKQFTYSASKLGRKIATIEETRKLLKIN